MRHDGLDPLPQVEMAPLRRLIALVNMLERMGVGERGAAEQDGSAQAPGVGLGPETDHEEEAMMVCKGCGTMHILLPEGATFDCPLCAANRERDEALARASEALALLATRTQTAMSWQARAEKAEARVRELEAAQAAPEPPAEPRAQLVRDGDDLRRQLQRAVPERLSI